AGGPVTYTLTVRNLGPGMVDATAIDFPPAALVDFSFSITGGTGACLYDPLGEGTGLVPTVLCDIPQFAAGEQRVVTIPGTLAPDSPGTRVENVPAVQNFPDLEFISILDNIATATFTPGTVDVAIEKTRIGEGTVPVGGEATFRLTARNDGDAPGTGIEVRD